MTLNVAIATALLLVGGAAYGSQFAANKIVADAGFPVIAYLFWQAALGAGLMLSLRAVVWRAPKTDRRSLLHFGASASFGMLVPMGVLAFVADKLPASVLTLTMTLIPAFTYLFAYLLRIETWRWLSIVAILLGLGGVLFIVLPQSSLPDASAAVWLLPALIAPVSAATNNLIVARLRPPESDSLTMAGAVLAGGTVVMLPIALTSGDLVAFWHDRAATIGVLWAGAVQSIGFFCLYEVVRRAGPVFFSMISYVIVASGIAWGYWLFAERPTAWVWAAVASMTIGLILANVSLARNTARTAAS